VSFVPVWAEGETESASALIDPRSALGKLLRLLESDLCDLPEYGGDPPPSPTFFTAPTATTTTSSS
jgi:hypothetical protein